MQLGELQHQYPRFQARNASIIALSVDPADDSTAMLERLGLQYPLASDPNQRIIQKFRVQNPDTRELALHAVYIVDQRGKVFYRKVGRRRPRSAELIDAIDARYGRYPRHDTLPESSTAIALAYPTNNYQTVLEISKAAAPSPLVHEPALYEVMELVRTDKGDAAVFAFRRMIKASPQADLVTLNSTAAWIVRQLFFGDNHAAIEAGKVLRQRLACLDEIQSLLAATQDTNEQAALQNRLVRARAALTTARATIHNNTKNWNLRYAKTMLRSYRELARAGRAN